jgi:CheY-like chemotaxis protein
MDKQNVLLVEDEAVVQQVLQAALEEAGFEVTACVTSEEAIQRLDDAERTFAALVTDIHLSEAGLTGWDVARRARELNPAFPVVYTTGAAGDEWPSNGVPNSILITKPYALAQVTTAVSQLLNTASGPTA